jgi:hypothetical protein
MPPAVFEHVIPISERLQTHALDRAAIDFGGSEINESFLNCITVMIFTL